MEKAGDGKDVLGGVLLAQLLWEECERMQVGSSYISVEKKLTISSPNESRPRVPFSAFVTMRGFNSFSKSGGTATAGWASTFARIWSVALVVWRRLFVLSEQQSGDPA